MKLSEQLREAIANHSKSAYEIAWRSRIHQSQISRFLRGKSKLSVDTIDKIGQVLGLEITMREPTRQHGEISESRTRSHTEQ